MEAKYFTYIDDEVKGPFDEQAVKQMKLNANDQIYTAETDWQALKTFKNLYEYVVVPPAPKDGALPYLKYLVFAFLLIALAFLARSRYEQNKEKRFRAEQREYQRLEKEEKMQQKADIQQKITLLNTELANLNIELSRAESRITRCKEQLDNAQSFQFFRTAEERDGQVYNAKRNLEIAQSEYYTTNSKITRVNKAIADLSKKLEE